MNVEYKYNEETEFTKANTDIILNGEVIGYYVLDNEEFTCFVEVNGEIYCEDFNTEEEFKTNIKYFLEQCW